MGATRKLQGEIDKVLKKVQEGVDVFDSIWNKVYDTENANQKEKFEADLKKEIKKLQRYRDQIKTWLQSSEIKDKKALLDARKLIEREMERFKVCEKETKTKAFSKEGLGQQPKTDPREKAKGESRDWLNNMVSELESQVDIFEAELEGLTVKKGKSRPNRLIHLEESISRHKQHIIKLEQILRLLDNDGVSPEQVNEVKDLVEDYVERNQDDFDEFADVDEFYSSIPLEKIEALENMESIASVTSVLLNKEKVSKDGFLLSQPADDNSTQQGGGDSGSKTPPLQTQQDPPAVGSVSVPAVNPSTSLLNGTNGVGSPTILSSVRVPKISNQSVPSSPVSFVSAVTEEEAGSYLGRNLSLTRGGGRGTLPLSANAGQPSPIVSIGMVSSSAAVTPSSGHGIGSSIPDLSKRSTLAGDERLMTGGLTQQLNPSGSQSRFMQPTSKLADIVAETGSSTDGGIIGGSRIFSPPGSQWRSPSAIPFQSPETGQFLTRTEIAPDQKQKFLQRLQQVSQQQQHNNPLLASAQQMSHLAATNQKQLQLLQNQPGSLLQSAVLQQQQQQSGLTLGAQSQVTSTPTTPSQTGLQQGLQAQQQATSMPAAQQIALSTGGLGKENESTSTRMGDLSVSNPQHKLLDDVKNETATLNTPYARPAFKSEDDLKNADTFDVPVAGPGTLAELSRWSSNVEPGGQNVQSAQTSASGPGVIGRRSGSDLGAIGDNLISTAPNDQLFNLQMLEAASHKMPLPQDSEQSRSYTPRHPAVTPSSYPQTPAEVIDNPAFWERLDTDVLFFAFYYQQGTYQQYLAARELKKQSWRYHKKYNTWFQRHEEPKVTTDEYEQGTYVYFDFHILHDDFGQGWCQRIKTEFTFEYSYLEDELVV
ncbi:hypothetical protein GOP47_0007304 [Adiantum capillus-veneris]|uniref:CCR4-NOT transcription complex subunit 3 n=1 Tax=Adiantum capillus-veneris TaxID=13818 RepID=A0A9D4V121_ADICA|nr:hypothetical protein GOP47_0007304 [Adiantum capillus-veneris]